MCFLAGANSIFTGDKLLTTANAGDSADAALLAKLGMMPMNAEEPMRSTGGGRMISSLLIANRGEIACRIIRTAREMGIRTVAVYSDADAKALHVRQADEAVHIGPSPARESYLVGDKIIAAAKATGAEAIHPGYGFLSENADFAQAVIDAGLVWVGPKPDSHPRDGAQGRRQGADGRGRGAGDAGLYGRQPGPGVPRRAGGDDRLSGADQGGRGRRRQGDAQGRSRRRISPTRSTAASARRRRSFGNDVVLIEKWIESPRHIEVQVFGDTHGNVVHLFERDCSLQRRHQKVIEEAPAPGMDEATREAVCGAAVKAAQAVNYEGAGTIEFIADASEGLRADRIWFMEMNTRLQVEHPVTEEITGVDLVEWQLRVASGEPLPLRQDELSDQRPGDRGAALCRGSGEGVPAERRAARAFRPWRATVAGSKPGSRKATRSRLSTIR